MTQVDLPTRRRPRDRKDQILEQAALLFTERGFPSVTMEEIADAAGITARALYRHYDNKAALLARVITTSQESYFNARTEAGLGPYDPAQPLTQALSGLIEVALATRHLTILWQREARYLPEDERRDVRHRLTSIVAGIRDGITAELPDLGAAHVDLRAWGVSSTLTSLGFHDLTLPGDALHELLRKACVTAARTPPISDLTPLTADDEPAPASRREQILSAAASAFARSGFPPVSTTTIAGRAGIAGPGIYRYFPSKQAILDALVQRHDEWLALEHRRALRTRGDRRLHDLVEGYVRVCTDDPDLLAVNLIESPHAAAELRDTLTRNRADREQTWIDCVHELDPAVTKQQARILVRAATSFIDDTVRTPRLWARDGVAAEITAIACSILTLDR